MLYFLYKFVQNKIMFLKFLDILEKEIYNKPVVSRMDSKFKILISTIISARTKDETTEKVCEKLFLKVKDFEDLRKIDQKELEELLYPAGFYREKAKRLKELANIMKQFGDVIPNNLEDLIKLPGVGIKTATLYLSLAEKIDEICVDTHVHRITNRWEFVDTLTPEETYYELKKKLPKKYWKKINDLLVIFGKTVCKPFNPDCNNCKFKTFCPYFLKWSYFYDVLNKYGFNEGIKNEKGTYVLHLYLKKNKNILIGKKKIFFKKGHYFYVGSAYGKTINLQNRINRHLKKEKNKHWHIDYFLEYANIKKVYTTSLKCEKEICKDLAFLDFIKDFGNSDDNKNPSHLFYIKP